MKRIRLPVLSFPLLMFCFLSDAANADWISFSGAENAPNIAEIYIHEDHVRIELEIFVGDMVAFDRLIPDSFFEDTDIKRPPLADRMRRFSEEDSQVIDDKGLTTFRVPLASVLCLLMLAPLVLQAWKCRRNGLRAGLLTGAAVLCIAGSVLLQPFLRVSVARPAAMSPEMTAEKAVVVLDSLLKNVYRAFDFREEEDVYDRLATSVAGDLLSDIYLQNRKSLIVTQAGGARARVKEVEILEVKVDHLDGRSLDLLLHARWTAMGTVGHWGHIHTRKNQYEANINVQPVDGVWKITHLELLEEERIDPYGQSSS